MSSTNGSLAADNVLGVDNLCAACQFGKVPIDDFGGKSEGSDEISDHAEPASGHLLVSSFPFSSHHPLSPACTFVSVPLCYGYSEMAGPSRKRKAGLLDAPESLIDVSESPAAIAQAPPAAL